MLGDTQLLVRSIGSLLLVLAILLAMVFASRWFMQRRPKGMGRLRFIEAMALGNRDKVLLIEVDGQPILLGVTSHNIRLLTKLDAKELGSTTLNQSNQQKTSSSKDQTPGAPNTFSMLFGRHTLAARVKNSS